MSALPSVQALQIQAPCRPEIVEIALPEPGPGEVLVKVEACLTCAQWDLSVYQGVDLFGRPNHPRYPQPLGRPGHEMAGTVVRCGPGVDSLQPGDRVAPFVVMGEERGTYAEFCLQESAQLLAVPQSLPFAEAALLEMATCVAAAVRVLGEVKGRRIGIGGLGGAGLIALQMLRALGAKEIIGFDKIPARLTLAMQLGADEAVDVRNSSSNAGRLEAAIDCSGQAESAQNLLSLTRGPVALFGVPHGQIHYGLPEWSRGASLLAFPGNSRRDAELARDLLAADKIRAQPLISATLPLCRYGEGVDLLARREAIKVCFIPQRSANLK